MTVIALPFGFLLYRLQQSRLPLVGGAIGVVEERRQGEKGVRRTLSLNEDGYFMGLRGKITVCISLFLENGSQIQFFVLSLFIFHIHTNYVPMLSV